MNSGVTWDGQASRNSRNASIGTTNGFNASELSTILAGYNTCDATNTYGYNAYPQLKKNFFDKCQASVLSSTSTLQDYDYAAYVTNGKSYDGINKDSTSRIVDKIAWMKAMFEANN